MKKALEVAKEISKGLTQNVDDKSYKSVFCESVGTSTEDGFTVRHQSKELSIHASNSRSAAYAISQLKRFLQGRKLQEITGESRPLYSLRPLWVHCDQHVSLSENVGLYLPSFLLGKKRQTFEKFCHRLLELGFNAVILGARSHSVERKSSVVFKELEVLRELFDDYGIQLIVKPVVYHPLGEEDLPLTPCDERFRRRVSLALSDLRQLVPSLGAIFWESVYCDQDFHYHPAGRGYSKSEKTAMELQLLEGELSDGQKLIYYLPTPDDGTSQKQAQWFVRLLNEAGTGTICAFSCVAGNFSADHLQAHPFWEVLYQLDPAPSTPVMPILNSGGIGQGEGYWPNFPMDLFEEYQPYRVDFPIAGFIHHIRNIPKKGSLADACAWVAGMSMWRRRHPKQLLEVWYRGQYSEGSFEWFASLLKKARAVILEISSFDDIVEGEVSSEEIKSRMDTVFAQIKEIEVAVKAKATAQPMSKGAMKELFQLFIKDARRKVLHFSFLQDASAPSSKGMDFKGDGVWTQLSSGGVGEGAMLAARVSFYEAPNIGEEGSPSHKVHWEVNIEV